MPLRAWLAWIAALYTVSLALPAFRPWSDHEGLRGFTCLWLGVVYPVAAFPMWWANPLLFAGCVFLARGDSRKARVCGLLATALASSFVLLYGIASAQVGSAFWVASAAALTGAGFDRARRLTGPNPPPLTSDPRESRS
jgi:hypothetical protein